MPLDDVTAPSLDGPWSISESGFAQIIQDMGELTPRVIVEFGSGPSSVRLAKAFPGARILSLESDEKFFLQSRKLAQEHRVKPESLHIALRPLRFRLIGASIYQTYERGSFPAEIDAVLIDGPPHWTGRGREACLHDVVSKLRVGGRVYLDDYHRHDEQQVVRNWTRYYAGVFRVSELAVGHGICKLEKLAGLPWSPRLIPAAALDSWVVMARRGYRAALNIFARDDRAAG